MRVRGEGSSPQSEHELTCNGLVASKKKEKEKVEEGGVVFLVPSEKKTRT